MSNLSHFYSDSYGKVLPLTKQQHNESICRSFNQADRIDRQVIDIDDIRMIVTMVDEVELYEVFADMTVEWMNNHYEEICLKFSSQSKA